MISYDSEKGVYVIITDAISAVEFDKTYTVTASSGATITYSVASYVANKDDDAKMGALVKALYNYGCSAKAYAQS